MFKIRLSIILCLMFVSIGQSLAADEHSLLRKLEANADKQLPIIVQFKTISGSDLASSKSSKGSSSKSSSSINTYSNRLNAMQDQLLVDMGRIAEDVTQDSDIFGADKKTSSSSGLNNQKNHAKKFKSVPQMALTATKLELEQLMQNPNIVIFEDKLKKPFLAQSVKKVYPHRDDSPYHGGTGWTVAVLDTGVKKNHSFLSGKVVSEACYSNGGGNQSSITSSLCPGGVTSSTATNSGVNCNITGCEHGTMVAGAAVGNGSSLDGVARDAKLISIQVYSQVNDESFCFPDLTCTAAYTSDIIAGLDRVYQLRNAHKIAAVNISSGSDELFSGTCDDQPEKPAIDLLKGVNIAVIAAVGNSGDTSKMPSPACISTAIAVAASNDANGTAYADNNTSNALDLFAPGVNITSSFTNGGYATATGTSFAAPHVAGAWAVIRNASPNLSVNQVTSLLKSHGPSITQNSVSRRRLDVTGVLNTIDPTLMLGKSDVVISPIIMLLLDD